MFERISETLKMIRDPMYFVARDPEVAKTFCIFLNTLAYTEDPREVSRLGGELFAPFGRELAWPLCAALFLLGREPALGVRMFRMGVRMFMRRFVAEGTPRSIRRILRRAKRGGYRINFDIVREAVQCEADARGVWIAYHDLISAAERCGCAEGLSISLKLSSFFSRMDPASPDKAVRVLMARLSSIVARIKAHHGSVFLDAEEYERCEIYSRVFERLYDRFGAVVCAVVQAYFRDSRASLDRLAAMQRSGEPIRVRLVRGAYHEYECAKADENDWEKPPVFTKKWQTDENFLNLFFKGRRLGLVMDPATQNIESLETIVRSCDAIGNPVRTVQVLNGLAGAIVPVLVRKGYEVLVYQPVLPREGDIMAAAAYLFRRIVELISESSFLAQHQGRELALALEKLKDIPKQMEVRRDRI